MNLGEKIRYLRKKRGLTLQEVADTWGVSRSSVSGWEAGDSRPDVDKLAGLARKFNVTVDYLLSDQIDIEVERRSTWDKIVDANVVEARTAGRLPLISWVQAGQWSEIVDNFQPGDAEEWIPCPFNHGPNAFVLRVQGLSMYNPGGEKSYAPGEYIAVDPRAEPLNRKMVVARLDHQEVATFKQLIVEPDGTHLLQALNPSWPERIIAMPPDSRIVGVVIGKWTPE